MDKEKVIIEIKHLGKNFPYAVDYDGHLFGGGTPCKTKEEANEEALKLAKKYPNNKIIDNTIKQNELF